MLLHEKGHYLCPLHELTNKYLPNKASMDQRLHQLLQKKGIFAQNDKTVYCSEKGKIKTDIFNLKKYIYNFQLNKVSYEF